MTNNDEKAIYEQYLEQCLIKQKNNIQHHTLPNKQVVWVRRSDSHNSIWLYRLLDFFVKILKADALKPVPSLGGKVAIVNEANAITRLSQCGVRVPQLLAINDNALMMTDIENSQTLISALYQTKKLEQLLAVWKIGVEAIVDMHNKNTHVSQCFARNMMINTNNEITFIDFEDAPEKVLSLANCQIRDWLCFLHSTAFLLDDKVTRQKAIAIWRTALGSNAEYVSDELYYNTRFLLWGRHLHDERWRKDTLKVASVMRFVWALGD